MRTVNANSRIISDLMENIFEGRWNPMHKEESVATKRVLQPPVNIYETDQNFQIEVLAPGVPKDAIKLSVEENVLTLSYEKPEATDEAGAIKTLKNEFKINSFKRSFTLGEKVDTEKINASYENGLLKIMLIKKEIVKPQVKDITIN